MPAIDYFIMLFDAIVFAFARWPAPPLSEADYLFRQRRFTPPPTLRHAIIDITPLRYFAIDYADIFSFSLIIDYWRAIISPARPHTFDIAIDAAD